MASRIKMLLSAAVMSAAAFACSPAHAVSLTMYYPVAVGGPLTDVVDDLVARFEKEHPDIDVEAVYSGNYADTMTKAMTALRGGQPPQISVLLSSDLQTLIDEDAIVPIGGIEGADKDWLDGFYPGFMANSQTGGKVWSVPFQRSTIVLYYNKEAFEEAGLNPDQPPKTWDEMRDMAAKLVTKDGDNVKRWGIEIPSTGYPYWMLQALAIENGQELFNDAGNEVYFDAPKTVEALKYWVGLSAEDHVMPKGAIEWGTLRSDFLEGKTAMMWHSTGNLTAVKDGAKFDFGVAMLPTKERPGSPTGGGNFYVFKSASPEQQKAAVTFMKWMTTPERAAEWSMKSGYVAVSPAAYETEEMKAYVEEFPQALVARDQLEHAVAELAVHENGRIYKILNDAVQSAVTGSASPEDALSSAQNQADRVLRRYR